MFVELESGCVWFIAVLCYKLASVTWDEKHKARPMVLSPASILYIWSVASIKASDTAGGQGQTPQQ